MAEKGKREQKEKTQWHLGFDAAILNELKVNWGNLDSEREYVLNINSLRVDLLVIKKDGACVFENEIGRFFRKYNLLEYKSPEDQLGIDVFYKVMGYAALYKAYGKEEDSRKAEDITVTLVRWAKPEKLIRYLAGRGHPVENPYHGIYQITEGMPFATQMIVCKELDPEKHVWLRALTRELTGQELEKLIIRVNAITDKQEKAYADAVLQVCMKANEKVVRAWKEEQGMCQALMELMAPELDRSREEGRKEGEENGMRHGLRMWIESLRELGMNEFSIKENVMAKSGLSEDAVLTLLRDK